MTGGYLGDKVLTSVSPWQTVYRGNRPPSVAVVRQDQRNQWTFNSLESLSTTLQLSDSIS